MNGDDADVLRTEQVTQCLTSKGVINSKGFSQQDCFVILL